MTPAARASAIIELLDLCLDSISSGGAPADQIVSTYFRQRRYAGSKDKRYIRETFYKIMRSYEGRAAWLGEQAMDISGRSLLLSGAVYEPVDEFSAAVFDPETPHGPDVLNDAEKSFIEVKPDGAWLEAHQAAQLNIPDWAEAPLKARFGDQWEIVAAAFNDRAPLTLRINTVSQHPEKTRKSLKKADIDFTSDTMAPGAIEIVETLQLNEVEAYKKGWVEVQDASSQIGALLVEASSGDMVADLCAGAGGKTLAIGAHMRNRGLISAYDTSPVRLDILKKRANKASLTCAQIERLPEGLTERQEIIGGKAHDRVVLDVPCSGSGTWRRSPDLRQRNAFSGERAEELATVQRQLLEEGAGITATDGRLIYMTCSFLPAENEDQITWFLDKHPDWSLVPWQAIWRRVSSGKAVPESHSSIAETLQLSPHTSGADGFFVAILERST